MIKGEAYEYLVVGAGPTGLSAISELLAQGVDPTAMLIIDPEKKLHSPLGKNTTPTSRRQSVSEVAKRERLNLGLGKGSRNLRGKTSESGTYSWGLSCLPPINFDLAPTFVPKNDFISDYHSLVSDWGVQSTFSNSKLEGFFPITGERLNSLRRKIVADKLVSADSRILHSRLALTTIDMNEAEGCKFHGTCFNTCPNNAAWTPLKAWKSIRNDYPGVKHLEEAVVRISNDRRFVETRKHTISYEKIILSAGWQSTSRLIQSSVRKEFTFQNTPVVLLPIYFRLKVEEQDFYDHFNYTDLIVPQIEEGKITSFSQIYLPTSEIAGRIIAQMPKFAYKVAQKFGHKSMQHLISHTGIAMIFLPPTINEIEERDARIEVKKATIYLDGVLQNVGAKVLNFKKNYLLNGASHHVGSIGNSFEKNRGVNSEIFETLVESRIFLADTSALPELLPGPHTAASSALSKSIARMAVQS